jgi:hypothetical protein
MSDNSEAEPQARAQTIMSADPGWWVLLRSGYPGIEDERCPVLAWRLVLGGEVGGAIVLIQDDGLGVPGPVDLAEHVRGRDDLDVSGFYHDQYRPAPADDDGSKQ